eukprot:524077_1
MSTEVDEIKELLLETHSDIYKRLGIYLHELEFTSDILDDGNDCYYADLFAEDIDCWRIGIPIENGLKLKEFIVKRSENIIKDYSHKNKSKMLLLKALQLLAGLYTQIDKLHSNNYDNNIYRKIAILLFKYQVNCNDINHIDDIRIFVSKFDLIKMGQEIDHEIDNTLTFHTILSFILNIQKQPKPKERLLISRQTTKINDKHCTKTNVQKDKNDITIFKTISTRCYKGRISSCSYLQRIAVGLKYYALLSNDTKLNKEEDKKNIFIQFCMETYHNFLDDYCHILQKHGGNEELMQIADELKSKYEFKECDITKCNELRRHFRLNEDGKNEINCQDTKYRFYADCYDRCHHHFFHLFELALRSQPMKIKN